MKDRKLVMVPGPIEFTPEVLGANGEATSSEVTPGLVEVFGQALERLRRVFFCPNGQPFVIAGWGSRAMDLTAANLVEPGDKELVVNTGYFSDRIGAILKRYGASVTHVRAPAVGDVPGLEKVESALQQGGYKVLAFTHVDTSTAVLVDAKALGALGQRYGVLTILDGVCSVAGEEIRQEEWGIDVAFTASQKAIGVPPGLALLVAGPRAIDAFRERRAPVGSFYANWANWLRVMEAYEARRPAYFGTPALNHVWALNVSLGHMLEEGMEARFARHRRLSRAFKAAVATLGLRQVPVRPEVAANTLTALYYPEGVDKTLLGYIEEAGVIVAGGVNGDMKDRYFRVGHMGAISEPDILTTVGAIERGLMRAGYRFEAGVGLADARAILA